MTVSALPTAGEAISQFKDAIRASGLEPPDMIEPGKLHRFPGVAKRNGNTAGWCKLFDDGLGGCFGDWSSGFTENWQAKRDKPFTQAERAAFMRRAKETRKHAEAERQQQHADAAEKSVSIWATTTPANEDHSHLVRKNIKANGARMYQDALVLPLRSGGEIHSLQFIDEDGNKRFLSGGRTSGCYFSIGTDQGADALCIAEGFATGATIHQVTGYPVAVAFYAGNLEAVAKAMRQKLPELPIIICADDDADTEGNPGITKANHAALAIGGKVAIPSFGDQRPAGVTDFNDMAALLGCEAVAKAIHGAITPDNDPEPYPLPETPRAAVEEVHDLLDDLLARTEADPGAPFAPDVLEALVALRRDDRARFEGLRAQLKRAGCRVTALDEALAEEAGDDSGRGPKQADLLIELAQEAELFHGPDATAFADLVVNGHRETWPVRTKGFKRWLTRRFFEATGGAPNSEALQSALNVIEAKAHFDGTEREVHIRIGGLGDNLYLDLGDEAWRAVEIDSDGWRVVDEPPVRFRRAAGMQALPTPQSGGSIETLRRFLNVQSDNDFILVVAWALAVLRNRGPYPVIVLSGEQGSAKSTFSAILRSLLDPNTAPLRALPREDRDLFIAANNGHVLAFDNVSGLPAWISDTLCRLATGGGFAVRQLYTDQDEVLFDAARPVILNGIEDIVTRQDLADRAIFLTLEAIPEERRRPEKELWAEFNANRPQLLGTLLDTVSHGLKRLPDTRLDCLPRMADFALWATACETALWPTGTFGAAYTGNRDEAVDSVIEADPVGSAIRSLMGTRTEWTGTASDLLGALDEEVGEKVRKSKAWPSTARALSGRVRRSATFLRKVGIDIMFDREGRARTRTIRITRKPESAPARPSIPSAPSAQFAEARHINGCDQDDPRTVVQTVDRVADANTSHTEPGTVRDNHPENNELTTADGADASLQTHSTGWRARL